MISAIWYPIPTSSVHLCTSLPSSYEIRYMPMTLTRALARPIFDGAGDSLALSAKI